MSKNRKLSNDEIAYFCEQLSLVVNAGIPLSDGMGMIADNVDDPSFRRITDVISKNIAEEKTLFEAMSLSEAFPEYAVNMVKIGTLSGRLDDVLKGLAAYYEDRGTQIRTIRSAVLHPVILIAMMTVVIIVLIVQVVPMFSDIFGRFDSTVSEAVNASVGYAYQTGTVILVILLVILLISGAAAILSRIGGFRKALSGFASRFILTRRIARVFTQAKFAGAMSMMVASGIEASEALENSMLLIEDKKMLEGIKKCRDSVVEGEPFADALHDAGLLPPIYARSLKMAYKSGSFDDAWKKISDRCSTEAQTASENLISFIEPVLIAVMSVIIGAILLTVMLPMMDIMSALG